MDTRAHAIIATLPHPATNPWMAVSIGLMGIITGFFLHAFTKSAQAHTPGVLPPPAPRAVQAAVIRPPDPTAIGQGGGCGGGGAGGGLGCGGAGGAGCGAGCGGAGGGCGAIAPVSPTSPTT